MFDCPFTAVGRVASHGVSTDLERASTALQEQVYQGLGT